MIDLEITGFQSIERVSLKVDRFTALVGRSNIGKSAIVRAVKAALTGAAGTDFVRHDPTTCTRALKGTKKCRCKATVKVTMPELTFLWEKGDSDNRYTVWRNGTEEVFDKLDRGTPEFLAPVFSPIKVGDSNHLINVGDQFDPIFLLGDPGSAVADVLSDVAKLDNLNAALRLVAKDKTNCSSTLKVRELDAQTEAAKLAGFADLDPQLAALEALQDRWAGIQQSRALLDRLTGLLDRITVLAREITGLEQALKANVPEGASVIESAKAVATAYLLWHRERAIQQNLASLKALTLVEIPGNEAVVEAGVRLTKVTTFVGQMMPLLKEVDRLTKLTSLEMPSGDDLSRKVLSVGELAKLIEPLQALLVACKRLQDLAGLRIPAAGALEDSLGVLVHQATAAQGVSKVAQQVSALEAELLVLTTQLEAEQAILAELAVCPTCGKPVHEDDHQ